MKVIIVFIILQRLFLMAAFEKPFQSAGIAGTEYEPAGDISYQYGVSHPIAFIPSAFATAVIDPTPLNGSMTVVCGE